MSIMICNINIVSMCLEQLITLRNRNKRRNIDYTFLIKGKKYSFEEIMNSTDLLNNFKKNIINKLSLFLKVKEDDIYDMVYNKYKERLDPNNQEPYIIYGYESYSQKDILESYKNKDSYCVKDLINICMSVLDLIIRKKI